MKNEEIKLWNYLRKKLSVLNDNNKTAREIFEYISSRKVQEEDLGNLLLSIASEVYTDNPEIEARFNLNKLENFIREYESKLKQ